MIHPFSAPCPKCTRSGTAKRYEREITQEAYDRVWALVEDDQSGPLGGWRDIPRPPQEEHLVRECECGHVFWTRTADYDTTAEILGKSE